jgi:hypothetical protein
MALVFDDGTLSQFCIVKGSAAEGLIKIPIQIIEGIIGLPTKAIEAEINLRTGETTLFREKTKLLETQRAYVEHLEAKRRDPQAPLPNALTQSSGALTVDRDNVTTFIAGHQATATLLASGSVCTEAEAGLP